MTIAIKPNRARRLSLWFFSRFLLFLFGNKLSSLCRSFHNSLLMMFQSFIIRALMSQKRRRSKWLIVTMFWKAFRRPETLQQTNEKFPCLRCSLSSYQFQIIFWKSFDFSILFSPKNNFNFLSISQMEFHALSPNNQTNENWILNFSWLSSKAPNMEDYYNRTSPLVFHKDFSQTLFFLWTSITDTHEVSTC